MLKCNHDSGSVKVIKSKSALTEKDVSELKQWFDKCLKRDFFYDGRECYYKGIERFIFAEKYMINESSPESAISDYKFFCFNGVPKLMYVATDRNIDCNCDVFDMDFNHLDVNTLHHQSKALIPKPEHFEEMKTIAAKLSKGIKHVRVDLYEINGKIYFGEFTFFHGGGFRPFQPKEWDEKIASWIEL